ncbi:Helix-turn-helix of DDE superfamily endonuclease [Streptomyces sp. 2224.1]|nr:DDE superfamily endonuclease [Streptomyces sp. 2321.6]SDQ63636.1 Helix-turn-helix of DDE superfamily endonuclease [Streptomyces sp. KS_16]SED74397.1 Helix-turn-helix of DDE superfamily endonuclease [Streptomyces sp. 2224.1]SEE17375.1 Helix-turn-helix of DDE superfamily endonuclease [Streptomyces sp. 2133.1]SNC74214.1 Helix-turn-helix of DDE superfamily endonuclease [Streptomyces sp. 2114.4]
MFGGEVERQQLRHLSCELAARRREIGTRWRRLTAGRQALLALDHLRCGDTYAQLAAGFGIEIATVYHYIREAIEVLAELAPTLDDVMATARRKAYVIPDGTVPAIDRKRAHRTPAADRGDLIHRWVPDTAW